MAGNCRSLKDINDVLQKAKLDPDEFLPLTQPLKFSKNIGDDDLILLELEQSLLDDLIHAKSLVFRGEKTDEAVLCTEDKTFDVKNAETSNALLISPDCKAPEQISDTTERTVTFSEVLGIHHMYYEVKPCKPKLQKIRQLLENNLYCGEEYETEDILKHNLETLLEVVQGSENEIIEELVNMHACYIRGYWRLLDHDYHFRLVSHIMEFIEAHFADGDNVVKDSILDALEDLEPRSILDQVFNWYADRVDQDVSNGPNIYQLNERNICRFYAEVLLRPADKFVLSDFLEAWKHSVPEGMSVYISYLLDMALTDTQSNPPVIWHFPAYDLPYEVNERFNSLFKAREKWTYEEINPFIQNMATEKMTVNAMLTKFARTSIINGTKYYNSKRKVI